MSNRLVALTEMGVVSRMAPKMPTLYSSEAVTVLLCTEKGTLKVRLGPCDAEITLDYLSGSNQIT